MLDFEILCGANVVRRKNVLFLWGRRSDVFINFMLSILLSNGYNVNFTFIFKLSPTDGQVTMEVFVCYRTIVTMWLKVSNLLNSIPNLYNNI